MSVALTEAELAGVAAVMGEAGAEPAGPLTATLIAGGRSNLTFRLDDGVTRWVLRTPPRAGRTPSAHDVAREHRVTAALAGTDVPVPEAVALCVDETVLGAPFAVAGFVDGVAVRTQDDLTPYDDQALASVMSSMMEALAALHAVDHVPAGLGDFGRPDAYAARQLRRWSGQWDLVGAAALTPLAEEVAATLRAALPDQAAVGIVHGDYRIDNTLLTPLTRTGGPAVAAVVDWELSTIGDPVADVAMMCAYRDPVFDQVVGEPSAWTSARLPAASGTDSIAAAYERAGGVDLAAWEFHLALAHYKVAVIAAGIDHRHRQGVGDGAGFESSGQAVEPYLTAAAQWAARQG